MKISQNPEIVLNPYRYRVHIVELNLYISKYPVVLGIVDMYKLKSLLESL